MSKKETNRDLVLECIRCHPDGLDDDQVSEISGVQPRQQVYQIASRLAAEGLIERISVAKPGKRKKIHNFFSDEGNLSPNLVSENSNHEVPLWKRRLAALVAATGRDEADILDEALEGFALDLIQSGIK